MLPVVPKRKYEIKLRELEEANKKIETINKDVKFYKDLAKKYETLAGDTITLNNELIIEKDNAKEALKAEETRNNILSASLEIYKVKALKKREKEINRLEIIINRTKSPYTKSKIENRILKKIENDIKNNRY